MKRPDYVLFPAILIFTQCTHYYYVPNIHNVTLFREKNEIHFSGGMGFGDATTSYELQSGYSINDKLAVSAAFMHAGNTKKPDSWGKGNYFEAAAGYYKPVKDHGSFQLFAGAAGSHQSHQYRSLSYNGTEITSSPAGNSDMRFVKLFLQPSYGWKFNAVEIALSTKLCSLSFMDINNQILPDKNTTEFTSLSDIEHNRNFAFFEPAITIRFGSKDAKMQIQGIIDSYANDGKNHFNEFHLSFGFYTTFKYTKKQEMQ